jgi:hypothetical protein
VSKKHGSRAEPKELYNDEVALQLSSGTELMDSASILLEIVVNPLFIHFPLKIKISVILYFIMKFFKNQNLKC